MDLLTILVIAVGLSMDAFAVSITSGAVYKKFEIKHTLVMAVSFGAFQAFMPIAGWSAGLCFRRFIQDFDHWVAFALLTIIGCKMIYEAFAIKKAPCSYTLAGDLNGDCRVGFLDFTLMALNWLIDCDVVPVDVACVPK